MKIKKEVLEVLNQCETDGNKLFLPQSQLERKLYVQVNKVLESIKLKWNRKEKCHIAEYDIEEKLNEIIETGEWTDIKKEYQFFETPPKLARRMVEIANIQEDDWVLEPSAGRGAIIEEILKCDMIKAVELNMDNYKYLTKKYNDNDIAIFSADFLVIDIFSCEFDKILMNPPFSKQQDIDHIMHAFKLLKDKGRLVAICSESAFLRENNKSKNFRDFLANLNANIEKLPKGTFKESGTMVNARLIIINK